MTGQRPCADEIMRGLRTTSDKIRALSRAGYTRTEIRDLLNIRYQHARKVLVDAGMSGGLQRQGAMKGSPVPSIAEAATGRAPCEPLLRAGFQVLGEWTLSGDGEIALNTSPPIEPGVYAFAVDDAVAYIGLTQTGLRTRMDHYRRGHERQRTSARVKGLIAKALAGGHRIAVLIATPAVLEWNGLPVNTAAGLEAGLIRMMRPSWNVLGAS